MERLSTSWAALKFLAATDVKWCQPSLVLEAKHLAGSKMLRHATVKSFTQKSRGLRQPLAAFILLARERRGAWGFDSATTLSMKPPSNSMSLFIIVCAP